MVFSENPRPITPSPPTESRVGHRVRDGSWRILAFGSLRQFVEWFYAGGAGPQRLPCGEGPRMRANCLSTTRCFEGLSVGCAEGAISPCRLDENAGKNTVMALTVSGHAGAHAEKPNAPTLATNCPVLRASLSRRGPETQKPDADCGAQRRRTFRRFAVPLAGLAVVLGDLAPARSRSSPSTSQRGMLVVKSA